MENMVNIKINSKEYSVPANSTILEAARYAGVEIPTLCYLKDINEIGACRLCLVEVKGARGLAAACVYPVNEEPEASPDEYDEEEGCKRGYGGINKYSKNQTNKKDKLRACSFSS